MHLNHVGLPTVWSWSADSVCVSFLKNVDVSIAYWILWILLALVQWKWGPRSYIWKSMWRKKICVSPKMEKSHGWEKWSDSLYIFPIRWIIEGMIWNCVICRSATIRQCYHHNVREPELNSWWKVPQVFLLFCLFCVKSSHLKQSPLLKESMQIHMWFAF